MTGQLPERLTCKSCGAQFSVLADQVPVHSRPVLVDGEWGRIGCAGTGELPGDAITAAAKVRLRQYDSEFNASHLSWQDFAGEAREVLEAAAPVIAAQATAAEREACARLAEQHNAIYYTKSDGYRPVAELIRARGAQ